MCNSTFPLDTRKKPVLIEQKEGQWANRKHTKTLTCAYELALCRMPKKLVYADYFFLYKMTSYKKVFHFPFLFNNLLSSVVGNTLGIY